MLRTALVLILAFGALEARADRVIEPVEKSFEVLLADAVIPAGGVGSISFKACDKCSSTSRLMTPGTQFMVGTQRVGADDFVKAAADARKAESAKPRTLLMIYVDIKSQNVTRAALLRPTH